MASIVEGRKAVIKTYKQFLRVDLTRDALCGVEGRGHGKNLTAQGPEAPSIGLNEHPFIGNDDVCIIMCVEYLRKMETTDKHNTLIFIHTNFHQGRCLQRMLLENSIIWLKGSPK